MYFPLPSHLAAGTRVYAATYTFLLLPLGPLPSLPLLFPILLSALFLTLSLVVLFRPSFLPFLSRSLLNFVFFFFLFCYFLLTSTFSPRIFSHCNLHSLSLLSSCCAFHRITSLACTLFCISFSLVFTSFRLSPSTKKI